MAKKTKKKVSNFLGFRLSEQILAKLDLIASQQNKTRGITAKDAIKQWLNLEVLNQNNEMITISKTVFIKLLSLIGEENLIALAEENSDLFSDIMKFLVAKPMNDETLKSYAKFSVNFFGKNGLKWFNTIDISIENRTLVFRGLHDLNQDFSNYFTLFYKNLLSNHFELEFKTKIEDTTPNLIHLEFHLLD